jgi:hypothetical protein
MDNPQALMDAPDGVREFFRSHVFQQISRGPSFESAAQVTGARKRSDNYHAGAGPATFKFSGNVEAGHVRHFDVGDKDVRLVPDYCFKRFFSVSRLGDDRDVAFNFEEGGKSAKYHSLVFGQNYADGFAADGAFFIGRIQLQPPSQVQVSVLCERLPMQPAV